MLLRFRINIAKCIDEHKLQVLLQSTGWLKKVSKNIWLIGFLDIEKSLENGTIILPASNLATGLYVNDQDYGVVGVKAIAEFSDNFGITASLPAAFFGNNVAQQIAFSFGVYKKF